MGDEPLGPCSTSTGRGRLAPAPYSRSEGLASLALGGMAVEPSPSLGTPGSATDLPAPASTSGAVADPPTPADT